jgi:hypothetical protein
MGRKAKIKKNRQQSTANPETNNNYQSTQFVKHLEKLGYPLKQIERSPELPVDKPEPQL